MRSTPPSRTQRGFTMALALALAVVMGVMLMQIGPRLSAEVQRENEAELIFRGEAIASALRTYFAQTKHYPADLDEVMKVRPRILRQKYLDPMTGNGEWQFVTQVQAGASGDTQGLPIVGVRSRSDKDSIHVYQGKTLVKDWLFSADENLLGGGATTENERTLRSLRGTTPTPPKP
ncbi:type II secretion system protein [Geothrix oryzisoli]|uniref:type II secretion system protein n=1 Tax=Geothrix oryzisoli TaxID=2922721 RepID=UPI001FACA53D|nr:type II secretion system protein [Geothrix oryzisoli]